MHRHARGVLPVVAASALAVALTTGAGAAPAAARASAVPGPQAAGSAGSAAGTGAARTGGSHTVTLITGDHVRVTDLAGGRRAVSVVPGAGRAHIAFNRQVVKYQLTVLPSDAAPLVAAGRLDARLFNVTRLVTMRYDDAATSALPLIVSYPGTATNARAAATAAVTASRGSVVRALPSVNGLAVRQPKAEAGRLWDNITNAAGGSSAGARTLSASVGKVWLDARVKATLNQSVPQIGAPQAWAAGYTGKGVKVAILDTGIDQQHPDVAPLIAASKDFSGSASGVQDKFGHGTHVASIVAGSGAASHGKYKGVAPDARLVVGKVLDDDGFGEESWIIAGMEWAADQGAKVANLSLGGGDTPELDPLEAAVNRLTVTSGTLFVIAAGNEGDFGDQTIGSPGTADAALTVGAVTKQDALADFSSRGPRLGDYAVKPDLTAPGVDIVAARAAGTDIGDNVDENYTTLSGTSMATPHVAGAAAILAQEHPNWNALTLKAALMSSTKPDPAARVWDQGTGRVDVARAVTQSVYAAPASLSFGYLRWPHDKQAPVTKTVRYHNEGADPVTLTVRTKVTGPDGKEAPSGLFTAGAEQVTVPAHGAADLGVTLNPAANVPDGLYGGQLTATSADGATVVQASLGVYKEPESYDVTIKTLDRTGKASAEAIDEVSWVGLDKPLGGMQAAQEGQATLRLEKGRYHFGGLIQTPTPSTAPWNVTVAAAPDVAVTRNLTLTFDARKGKLTKVTVDRKGVVVSDETTSTILTGKSWTIENGIGGERLNLYAIPTAKAAADPASFGYYHSETLTDPPARATPGSPRYNVVLYTPARIPAVLARHVKDAALTTVTDANYRQGGNKTGLRTDYSFVPGQFFAFATPVEVPLPGTRRQLFSPGPVAWGHSLDYGSLEDPQGFGQVSTLRKYRTGPAVKLLWNRAVDGPGFAAEEGLVWVGRSADTIAAALPLYSDSSLDHYSFPNEPAEQATVSLYRNGQLVGSAPHAGGEFPVPPEAAQYKLTATATRNAPWSNLSTKIDAEWTFSSAHVAGDAVQALPLSAIRLTAPVSLYNKAQAGKPGVVGVVVQRQAGAPAGSVTEVAVQVSFDDGRTWKPLTFTGKDGKGSVTVVHPALGATSGYVSLRASAKDTSGNTVTQTVIRAYQLK